MGSFGRLARRAVETEAPVMVKVMEKELPASSKSHLSLLISLVLIDEFYLSCALCSFFRCRNCFEGTRM